MYKIRTVTFSSHSAEVNCTYCQYTRTVNNKLTIRVGPYYEETARRRDIASRHRHSLIDA